MDLTKMVNVMDESSSDSGLGLETESPVKGTGKRVMRRDKWSDLIFSPSKDDRSPGTSPLTFKTLRSLNFDSPISADRSAASLCDDQSPRSFSSLFKSPIFRAEDAETPRTRGLASQISSLQIRGKIHRKRVSAVADGRDDEATPTRKRPRGNLLTRRCQSLELPPTASLPLDSSKAENEAIIMTALDRVSEDSDLISDGSKACCLPTVKGKHQDLKSITPDTLARVLNHEFDHVIDNYVIVDCRYPYEFTGGHIKGAKNYYTRDSILANLVNRPITCTDSNNRTVLIFHCEFSSERGPRMSRFLRSMDRDFNKDRYPQLLYPEIYLLHGGYKNFFETQKVYCYPQSYTPMHHGDYKDDLKKFRVKSKSWSGERSRLSMRRGLRF